MAGALRRFFGRGPATAQADAAHAQAQAEAQAERVRAEARSLNARADVELAEAKLRSAQADATLAEAGAKAEAIRELARVAGQTMAAGVPSDHFPGSAFRGGGGGGRGPGSIVADRTPRSGDYDASRRTRADTRWNTQGGAPDAHLDPQTAETLALRASSAQRNDMVVRAMVKRLTSLLIQDGWAWEIKTKDQTYRTTAEKLVRDYMETLTVDLAGLCPMNQVLGQCVGALCYRGRVLVNIQDDGRVQLIENERLRNPDFGPNTRSMINGVELRNGEIVAYHVADWSQYLDHAQYRTQRLPAAGCVLLRNPLDASEGQISGEPAVQAILPAAADLREFIRSTDIAARIATMFGGILETPTPAQMQQKLETANSSQPSPTYPGQPAEIEMKQGRILTAPIGTKFTQTTPQHPSMNHAAYIATRLMLMAADLGLPICLSHLDFTQVNFHSARSAVSVAWLGFLSWQGSLTPLIRRLINQRLAWHIRRGDLPMVEDWDSYELYPPAAPILDFTQEVASVLEAVRGGVMTYRAAIQRLGTGEWEGVFEQLGIERERMDQLGITPPDLPGASRPDKSAKPGSEPSTPATTDNPAPEAATSAEPAPPVSTEIQQTALNGAQVTALADLCNRVVSKELPLESAIALARAAFPAIDDATLAKIFDPLRTFTAASQTEPPADPAPDTGAAPAKAEEP
jgi:capsid protein